MTSISSSRTGGCYASRLRSYEQPRGDEQAEDAEQGARPRKRAVQRGPVGPGQHRPSRPQREGGGEEAEQRPPCTPMRAHGAEQSRVRGYDETDVEVAS